MVCAVSHGWFWGLKTVCVYWQVPGGSYWASLSFIFLCEMGLAIVPLVGSEQHSAGHLSAPQMLAPRVNLTIIHGLFNSSRCTPFTIISSPLGLEG